MVVAPFWLLLISPLLGRSQAPLVLVIRLRSEELQVFRLPAHRIVDAIPAAGMVEEDPLFDWSRIHLAILAEMNGGLREAIGLAAGVQAVHVGFMFVAANVRVKERRVHKCKQRTH